MPKTYKSTLRKLEGNFVIRDLDDGEVFNYDSAPTILNGLGAEIPANSDFLAQPVKGGPGTWEFCDQADLVANATTGFVIHVNGQVLAIADAASTQFPAKILARSSGVTLVEEAFPATDLVGAAFTLANLVSEAKRLGYNVINQPPEQTIQNT